MEGATSRQQRNDAQAVHEARHDLKGERGEYGYDWIVPVTFS
jgi:hypothetical protein